MATTRSRPRCARLWRLIRSSREGRAERRGGRTARAWTRSTRLRPRRASRRWLQPVATNPNDLAEMAVAAGLQGSVPQEPVLFTPTAPPSAGSPDRPSLHLRERSSSMKNRVSVICLQCGLSVDRLIHAETAQTEIDPVTYRRKCKIAPDAADFHCPELERAVERSRRWDPIVRNN